MNILIVEDDPAVADSLKNILKKIQGINLVQAVHSFEEGITKAMMDVFDVILIDIHLGDNEPTGIDLCKMIRQRNEETPIIMVTALHSMGWLERAFEAGANDYITKPFRIEELRIRTKRWIKMSHKISVKSFIEYKNLRYDPQKNVFFFKQNLISLTKKEKSLLLIFISNIEKTLSEGYLQEKFWGDYEENKNRNIRSNIQNLRHVLEKETNNAYIIQNIRGEGYKLAASH